MTPAEQFFYDNAGYCYDPKTQTEEQGRVQCASELARAEAHSHEQEWEVEWVPDTQADPLDWDGEGPMGVEASGCILRASDGVEESLWGIWDASPVYRRVVEAELALEALSRVEALSTVIAG